MEQHLDIDSLHRVERTPLNIPHDVGVTGPSLGVLVNDRILRNKNSFPKIKIQLKTPLKPEDNDYGQFVEFHGGKKRKTKRVQKYRRKTQRRRSRKYKKSKGKRYSKGRT